MPRAKKVKPITVFHPNAYYRLDNADGTLASVVALDRTNVHLELVRERDEQGRTIARTRACWPSLLSILPEDEQIALTREEDVERLMQAITYEEAVLLAPDFMARLKARSTGRVP